MDGCGLASKKEGTKAFSGGPLRGKCRGTVEESAWIGVGGIIENQRVGNGISDDGLIFDKDNWGMFQFANQRN